MLVVFFFFPETHNRTLEELSFMWEGDAAWGRVRERMDTAMATPLTELGTIKEGYEGDERVGHETGDDAS